MLLNGISQIVITIVCLYPGIIVVIHRPVGAIRID